MNFDDFALSPATLDGIAAAGYEHSLPIQEKVIPAALEGRDIIGCAQTGTGKTAAYLVPIIEGLIDGPRPHRFRPRALVLLPTRELALQVAEHFTTLASGTKLRSATIHGGVDIGGQEQALDAGAAVVIATPGRLLEHLARGGLKFNALEYLVIDEADRLFDEGFLPDLRRIVDVLPERRQTMLFSATIPEAMEQFARAVLRKPERIQIGLVAPRESIEDSFWPVPEHQKTDLLREVLREETHRLDKAIVFVRTRAKARNFAPVIGDVTGLPVAELHAELTQQQREQTIRDFREGKSRVLVATDVASRGLDIVGISHVVNFDVPNTPDDYIHRVGRTARVDRTGVAITLVSPQELALATAIEAALRRTVPVRRVTGFPYDVAPDEKPIIPAPQRKGAARSFTEQRTAGKPKEKPFTRSGELRPEFRDKDLDAKPRRKARQREERRILKKKLPHQRRK